MKKKITTTTVYEYDKDEKLIKITETSVEEIYEDATMPLYNNDLYKITCVSD